MSTQSNGTSRVLIVEDEIHSRRYLLELLNNEPGIQVVGHAENGAQGADLVSELCPDLVFLDIQMPELDAFEMITKVGAERMPTFIFVTAFAEYALRAFEVEALDYLCKPINQERLHASLERFRRYRARSRDAAQQHEQTGQKSWRRRLAIKEDFVVKFVPVERILWIEAANKYVVVRTPDHSYVSRQTIQSIVEELSPEHFVRTNRSIVVRKNAVREVKPLFHGDHVIVLVDGTELTLSRNYRENFFSEMGR